MRKADWHVTKGSGRLREEKKVCVCVCEESRLACYQRQGKTEGRGKCVCEYTLGEESRLARDRRHGKTEGGGGKCVCEYTLGEGSRLARDRRQRKTVGGGGKCVCSPAEERGQANKEGKSPKAKDPVTDSGRLFPYCYKAKAHQHLDCTQTTETHTHTHTYHSLSFTLSLFVSTFLSHPSPPVGCMLGLYRIHQQATYCGVLSHGVCPTRPPPPPYPAQLDHGLLF